MWHEQMDEGVNAVEPVVESTTPSGSAPEELNTSENVEASEKTEIAAYEDEGSSEDQKAIPYDRFKQKVEEVNQLKSEYEALKAKAEVLDRLQESLKPQEPQDPIKQRAEAQLKEMGYVKATDVEALVEQRLERARVEDSFMSQVAELQKKYDGSNGLPKFDPQKVAEWMDSNPYFKDGRGLPDLEKTFKVMYQDEFVDGMVKQKRGTAPSEKPGKPMSAVEDNSAADFEEAKKSGNWGSLILKRVGSPYSGG